MALSALQTAFLIIRSLREPLTIITRFDADLARQIRRAASSVPGNLAEGDGRTGRDQLHHFRVAYTSAAEVSAHLTTAVAWGYLDEAAVATPLALLDEVRAMTWRLSRPRR